MLLFRCSVYGDHIAEKLKNKGFILEYTFYGLSKKLPYTALALDAEKCSSKLWEQQKKEIADFGFWSMGDNGMERHDLPEDYLNTEAKMMQIVLPSENEIRWYRNNTPDLSPVGLISTALPNELLFYESVFGIEYKPYEKGFVKDNINLYPVQKDAKAFIKKFV